MSSDQQQPSVSVVLPCRNERHFIEKCLRSLLNQTGLPAEYEIIVADGCSDDGTAELVKRIAESDPRVKLITNEQRIVPVGLNEAIRLARGEIIVRADAHALFAPDYVCACVQELQCRGAVNVGGPPMALAESYFQSVVATAFHSSFATGGGRFHDPGFEGYVDTVQFGCWWREKLLDVDLFDETLVRNQDDELNHRLRANGGRIWQSPRIRAWYYPRSEWRGLYRQYFQYGYWKVRLLRKFGRPTTLRQLAPISALLAAAVLAACSPFSAAVRVVLVLFAAAYALLSLLASALAARRAGRWDIFPTLPVVFFLHHAGYATGYALGLFDWLARTSGPRKSATGLTR